MRIVTAVYAFLAILTALQAESGLPADKKPTQSLGAFIRPVAATATDSQAGAGRTPDKMIDGSGWDEQKPGSGVYVHTSDVSADGNCMWNGAANSTLTFDLGKTYHVSGVYLWNYNEGGGYNNRSVKSDGLATTVNSATPSCRDSLVTARC